MPFMHLIPMLMREQGLNRAKAEELHNIDCMTGGEQHDVDCRKQIDAIVEALSQAHRQGREEERAFFKKKDDSKWHDAEHCSCLGHAIHMAEKHADNPDDGCDCSLIAGDGKGEA